MVRIEFYLKSFGFFVEDLLLFFDKEFFLKQNNIQKLTLIWSYHSIVKYS